MKRYVIEYSFDGKDWQPCYDAKTEKSCRNQIELFWQKSPQSKIIRALKPVYDRDVYRYGFRASIMFKIIEG